MDTGLGARIRALREQAGIQSQELASALGIDPSAMSNIERGKRSVKTSELTTIAQVLSVSPLALLDEDSLPARMPVAARRDDLAGDIKGAAYSRLLALSELHTVLLDAVVKSSSNLLDVPRTGGQGWKQEADRLADWAISYLDVSFSDTGHFAQLAEAIETRLRVDVLAEKYDGDPLSGAAITDRSFPLIFVNSRHPATRSLFTLAHELGHLLTSHNGSIAVDDTFSGSTRDERQANAFATAFLMPETRVRAMIDSYGLGPESLARMLYEFGVSFQSLIFRLHNLRIINSALRDQLQAAGWQGLLNVTARSDLRERLGPEISAALLSRIGEGTPERTPVWLTSRCVVGYVKGAVSIRPLAGLLHVDPEILLDHIQDQDQGFSEALNSAAASPPDEHLSDDELFANSPVS